MCKQKGERTKGLTDMDKSIVIAEGRWYEGAKWQWGKTKNFRNNAIVNSVFHILIIVSLHLLHPVYLINH